MSSQGILQRTNAIHNRSNLHVLRRNYEAARDLQVVVEAEDSDTLKRTRSSKFGTGNTCRFDSALRVASAASPCLSPPASLTDRPASADRARCAHRLDARVEFAN